MKKSASELMKELKIIKKEIEELYYDDFTNGEFTVGMDSDYESSYDYAANRQREQELREEERKIKSVLNKFNNEQTVKGYSLTISEGLVILAQLKAQIDHLQRMASKKEFSQSYSSTTMLGYKVKELNKTIKELTRQQNSLQIAIDHTNLTSSLEV